ncbi:ArnT family glycosyltransferase [Cellulomonas fengjieae]|uniref:DUF2029 domain-containing protein n=1 Tax=Cellulomonas fengjieae TaxID=2819978 RepID=A0ABS3SGR8_9CELL|nr:glycosyltransferase 87 family protein [Cellulomonas fengjieae]MBO3084529.1 DUF2029 domain-containing protein [Cellulomonas fengjieae]QVI67138.1 DUF2029 domain-containing protein [Cellulomonas fengjieae]
MGPARHHSRAGGWVVAGAAGLLALLVRWYLGGGLAGLRGYHGYDEGVYFTSALSLSHGLVPYRDFLFLHPPGITVALLPFAALTHWTSDPAAFMTARVAFMLVGAANAVLVARIALRWGTRAAVVAGGLYGLSYAAANVEYSTMLEPLGSLGLLAAVASLLRSAEQSSRAWELAGGALLGLSLVVKIWDVVPAVVVIGWLWLTRGRAGAARVGLAATAAAGLVLLPFALLATPRMVRYVVLDQLGRPPGQATVATRLGGISGVDVTAPPPQMVGWSTLLVGGLVVVAFCAARAWHHGRGRLWVVLLAAQLGVLVLSPSYFLHYAAFSAPAAALVVAAGASTLRLVPALATSAAAAAALCLATAMMITRPPAPFPAGRIDAHLPQTGCIRSDSPAALVLLDQASRNLDAGCRLPVDLSGQTYDVGARDASGRPVPRVRNTAWQRAALRYLTSGSATVLVRPVGNGFDTTTRAELDRMRILERVGGVRVLSDDGRGTGRRAGAATS